MSSPGGKAVTQVAAQPAAELTGWAVPIWWGI